MKSSDCITMKSLTILLICLLNFPLNQALKCYTCSYTETDADRTCVDDPKSAVIKTCNKKYCTVLRQEYLDPKDKVASLMRTCEDNPTYKNTVVEDATHRTYYVACQSDLCNGGEGKHADSNDGYLGDKSTIICPGIGTSNCNEITLSKFLLFLMFVMILI